MKIQFDCLIVGGGPAGALAARVLANHGLQVAVFDPLRRPKRRIGESLPGAAKLLLSHLGLEGVLLNGHSIAYGNLSAWGSTEIVCTDFLVSPHGHGWHLDRTRFDHDLLTAATEAGAKLIARDAGEVRRHAGQWILSIDGEKSATAPWLIDCSGRKSFVCRQLGIKRLEDDDLTAVYNWFPADDKDQRTLVESSRQGWWYTSLIPGGGRVASLHTSRARAEKIFRNPRLWAEALLETQHVREFLPKAAPIQIFLTSANGGQLEQSAGPGWIAAGDAAMTFDPLSSQGLFNALYTGCLAADSVLAGQGDGMSQAIENYARRLEKIRAEYLKNQMHFYSQERRWLGEDFWRRRNPAQVSRAIP